MWIARHYDCYEPNTCLISNGFASRGFSIPGAFAAKLLNPDKKVLAVCGDGGFMMNSQELETAVREKAPVRPKRMDAFITSKEMQVPHKKLVKKLNQEKRAKKLKKGVAKRAGVWYYT